MVRGRQERDRAPDPLAGASARLRRASGRLLAVLFVDLDGFKLINDRYGHEAGDEVLAGAARRLRDVVCDTDVISRFGGDEFVIIAEGFSREGEALERGQIPGQLICLEVTETAAPARHRRIVEVLRAVRKLGIRVALDDFGAATRHSRTSASCRST